MYRTYTYFAQVLLIRFSYQNQLAYKNYFLPQFEITSRLDRNLPTKESNPMDKEIHSFAWYNLMELVVATWIIMSPFLLEFFDHSPAGLTAVAVGLLTIFISLIGIPRLLAWEEWFNLNLALFMVLSPWIFQYQHLVFATFNAVIAGAILAMFALLSLVEEYTNHQHSDNSNKRIA